jgi:hypothetical protein
LNNLSLALLKKEKLSNQSEDIKNGNRSTSYYSSFFSYSLKDQHLRDKLETQLSLLKREKLILTWHARKIDPGTEWADQIDTHLNQAQIILLLVSADFIDSDYGYNIEVKRAMERHSSREARVIPIILRSCDWLRTPFGELPALPTNGKPITDRSWHNLDEAFFNVAEGIRKVVEELNTADQDLDDKQRKVMLQTSLGKLTPEQSSRRFIRSSKKKKTKQAYLDYIVLSNETLELTGMPANLFINAFALEEIFISLEFRRARPLSDYPLTEEEIKWYHDELQKENSLFSERAPNNTRRKGYSIPGTISLSDARVEEPFDP